MVPFICLYSYEIYLGAVLSLEWNFNTLGRSMFVRKTGLCARFSACWLLIRFKTMVLNLVMTGGVRVCLVWECVCVCVIVRHCLGSLHESVCCVKTTSRLSPSLHCTCFIQLHRKCFNDLNTRTHTQPRKLREDGCGWCCA